MIDNQHVYGHAQFGHFAQSHQSTRKGRNVYSDDSWLERYYEDRNDSLFFTEPYYPEDDYLDEEYEDDEEYDSDDSDDSDNGGMPDNFGGDLDSDYSGSWQDSDNSDASDYRDFVDF